MVKDLLILKVKSNNKIKKVSYYCNKLSLIKIASNFKSL